jgi:hypothetical protein
MGKIADFARARREPRTARAAFALERSGRHAVSAASRIAPL